MQSQTRTYGDTSVQLKGDERSTPKKVALALFWVGLLVAAAFAGVAGWELTRQTFRTLTSEEFRATIWGFDGPLFMLWAFSVPLGSVLAGTGAFLYARTKRGFVWLAGLAVLGIVIVMKMVWSREYYSPLFGIGGVLILAFFFSIVWSWMKRYAALSSQEKTAGGLQVGWLSLLDECDLVPLWGNRHAAPEASRRPCTQPHRNHGLSRPGLVLCAPW